MKEVKNSSENLIREECGFPFVMSMPNSMSLAWGYEEQRDLVTSMTYKRGTTVVAARGYTYDNLGRPITRQIARQGSTVNDTFTYNSRSELIGATMNGKDYGYSYDNIGNRKTAQEDAEEATAYTANPLNQYIAIRQGSGEEGETFIPTYDADGNQTRIKTATGIWNVTYNVENRPTRFESADGATVIDCTYDYMGRRHTRKVTVNGTVSNYLRYIYRGYLQIAAIDAVSGVFRWFLFWDPTQPTATRPLAIRKDSTWYAYGWDLTKNVTEIFGKAGYLRTAYTYTPYGETTAAGDVTQPITWSSEYADDELALIYYNYRLYNLTDGRWINRDPIAEQGGRNLYAFLRNNALCFYDAHGLWSTSWEINPPVRRTYYINKNDTKQGLARLVGLDVEEFDKWAIPASKQRNASGLFCSYSVPNKWIAVDFLRGGGFWARFVNLGGTLGVFFGTDLSTYGLKVVKPKTQDGIKKELNRDVWGMVIFGHGNMYSDEIFDGSGNPMITQTYIRNEVAKNGYKLAKVYMMQCYSALNGNRALWKKHSMYLKDYDGINCMLFDI